MGNMIVSVLDEVQKKMKNFTEIKWSEVARKAIIEKLEFLLLVNRLSQKSRLTEKDIEKFSKNIKSSAVQKVI